MYKKNKIKKYFKKSRKLLTLNMLAVSLFITTIVIGFTDLKANDGYEFIRHGGFATKTYEFKGDTLKELNELPTPVVDAAEKEEIVEEPVKEEIIEEPDKELTIEERIAVACEEYDISHAYDIVLAIARLETGWFKSDAYIYGNNPGGLSVNEQPIYFDTIEEGVDRFVSNLANNYFGIGLDTPELIGQKYCPMNPRWADLVSELMTYGY